MVIQEVALQTRGMETCLTQIDYADTFSTTNHENSLEEVSTKIFGTAPGWVKALMGLRNVLVKVAGLKTDFPEGKKQEFKVGGRVAFFKIYKILDNEIILGEDDSHLNFRVSVYDSKSVENNIKVTTLVQYNNGLGKFYFAIVKPFHKLIVKTMVANAFTKSY